MKKLAVGLMLIAGMFFAGKVFAEPLTAALCKQKAIEAAKLVEAEGPAAFDKLRDPNGPFRFGDGAVGYVWVQNPETGVTLMHGVKPDQEGKIIVDIADTNGKYFFASMSELALTKGAGWVDYVWPKPGSKVPSPKVSYIVKAVHAGKNYAIGSGLYDVTKDDIKKLFPGDAFDQD